MKATVLAALLLAATAAQAGPVLTNADHPFTAGNSGLHHATLTLDQGYNLSLRLDAFSKLYSDLSFTTLTVSQGATSYQFNVPESFGLWPLDGNWNMNWSTSAMSLGSGVWDVAVGWNDSQPGNASWKRSGFELSLLQATPQVSAVPEPHGVALMGAGLLALGWVSRRKVGHKA